MLRVFRNGYRRICLFDGDAWMGNLNYRTKEYRLADIIWANEPIRSGELARICMIELNWKRTTTHTVLTRLCEKGLFQNDRGTVTSIVSKREYLSQVSREFVEEFFEGSLADFLAAFNTAV